MRVGGAIELFKAGYSLEKITEMGNWSDPKMVFRYIRGYLASEKAMVSSVSYTHLDVYKRQRREDRICLQAWGQSTCCPWVSG